MNTTAAECAGAQPAPLVDDLADTLAAAMVGMRRCLMLADVAIGAGNHRRAAQHLLGAIADLEPELSALSAACRTCK